MRGPRRRGASGPSLYPPASGPRSPAWSGLVPGPRPRPDLRPRPRLGPASSPAWSGLVPGLAPGLVPGLPCGYVLISHARQSPMSHVIPLHIFQTLKSDRWNCNVCGPSQKMTELNYVRLLLGRLPPSLSVLSTDHANRDQDWLQRTPSPRTVATITRTCGARRTPHGPLQNAPPRPSGARRTGGGGFAALGAGCRRVVGVSWF